VREVYLGMQDPLDLGDFQERGDRLVLMENLANRDWLERKGTPDH
jgi:hypothetical protein